ncbi:CPBP family glutamic-type intramembrane protease [Winogradskyella bathintestinalis]|uniref:CPBP family glutamic-type intramembrane protease n=1 Tax=Winogradskyella bathintestinalis TaxID=3035208 RepID=A0ABT7ZZ31_9FLAO|nr:CPBP family glutamic-type intramembrane protease [Winogradskyella bathintestinalis]MDN3494262.1 CPBP family glutamic-type intramembrane protease [Winogradskyella bathintestinalis]
MKTLKNLWILTKSGFIKEEEKTLRQSINFLFRLFFVLIVFKIVYFTLTYLIKTVDSINFPVVSTDFEVDEYSGIYQFLILTFLAPIFEELTFRLGLRFSKWNFILMTSGFIYLILKFTLQIYLPFILLIIVIISLFLVVILKKRIIEKLSNFWKNNRLIIFYSLLNSFALIHILNYELNISNMIYIPILVLPHFIAGLILSYARLKSGIILSICLHILNNGLLTLPLLFVE